MTTPTKRTVFEIAGGPALDTFREIQSKHASAMDAMDKLSDRFGIHPATALFNGHFIVGFEKGRNDALIKKGLLKPNEDNSFLVPDLQRPLGAELAESIMAIRPPSAEEITRKFGGEPFLDGGGNVHFISIKQLGTTPLLFVPDGVAVNLPEGLKNVSYLSMSNNG